MIPPRPSREDRPRRVPGGLPLRAIAPNAITALALCAGLSGVRFAIGGRWELAATMVVLAGALDGVDGRIARLLRGESRFGAELDSLSDAISFGVAPALILYLWSLQHMQPIGWICSLVFAVFCALRLARFNALIDEAEQPRKSAGFNMGVPAPAGAGLALTPLFLWLSTGNEALRSPYLLAPWTALIATLMVSSLATFSWNSLRLRRNVRFEALVLVVAIFAALVAAPWETLSAVALTYLATLPFGVAAYAKIRRLRAGGSAESPRSTPAG